MKKNPERILQLACCLLLIVLTSFANAQDTYTAALARYYHNSNGGTPVWSDEDIKGITSALEEYTESTRNDGEIVIPSNISSAEIAEQYVDEQLFDDFIAILMPYMRDQSVSINELNELSDRYESPEGKIATEHNNIMGSDENLADMVAIMQNDLLKLAMGEKVEKKTVNVSPERAALFSEFYQNSQTAEVMMMNSLVSVYAENDNYDKKLMKKFQKYFKENMEPLVLMSADILTNDDLRFYNSLFKMPAYKKCADGIKNFVDNYMTVGIALITKYDNWLKDKY